MDSFFIYILTNKPRGTLYIGMTRNLSARISQHLRGDYNGFSKRYNLNRLVYVEIVADFDTCRRREQQMKEWKRQWKINLIEKTNPNWEDLGNRY